MAMEFSSNYSSYANAANSKQQTAENKAATQTDSIGEAGLSPKAQALLEKLRKTHGDMDFMVADFDKGDDAKESLSRGTKEVSVVFSGSEIEKMASDEKYEQEYMERVQDALRMSEQINRESSFTSAFEENSANGEISNIGISFNSDGAVSFFAELERMENRYLREDTDMKRTTVQADSMEEFLEKIQGRINF